MGADFCPFFDQADRQVFSFGLCQLLESDGRGQARRAATDDQHVEFHGFAFHVCLLDYCELIFNTVQYGKPFFNPFSNDRLWNTAKS